MSKRRPSSQLNHDNWDQEEEPEEIGQYTPLSVKELQASGRVVKRAKRRLKGPDSSEHFDNDIPRPNPFAGFAGFSSITAENRPSFDFFGKSEPLGEGEGQGRFGQIGGSRGLGGVSDSARNEKKHTVVSLASFGNNSGISSSKASSSLIDGKSFKSSVNVGALGSTFMQTSASLIPKPSTSLSTTKLDFSQSGMTTRTILSQSGSKPSNKAEDFPLPPIIPIPVSGSHLTADRDDKCTTHDESNADVSIKRSKMGGKLPRIMLPEESAMESSSSSRQESPDEMSHYKREQRYKKRVKSLNASFLKWISPYMEKFPCCILSPVFDSYNRHLREIEEAFPEFSTSRIWEKEMSTSLQARSTPCPETPSNNANHPKEKPSSTEMPVIVSVESLTQKKASQARDPSLSKPTESKLSNEGGSSASPEYSFHSVPTTKVPFSFETAKADTKLLFSFGSSPAPSSARKALYQFGSSSTKSAELSSPVSESSQVNNISQPTNKLPPFSFAPAKPTAPMTAIVAEKTSRNEGNSKPPAFFTLGSSDKPPEVKGDAPFMKEAEGKSMSKIPVPEFAGEKKGFPFPLTSLSGKPQLSFGTGSSATVTTSSERPVFSFGKPSSASTALNAKPSESHGTVNTQPLISFRPNPTVTISGDKATLSSEPVTVSASSDKPFFTFGSSTVVTTSSEKPSFSFGTGASTTFGSAKPGLSMGGAGIFGAPSSVGFPSTGPFGSSKGSTVETTGFRFFGSSKPTDSSSGNPPTLDGPAGANHKSGVTNEGTGDDENYEPPKPDVHEVVESDAFFSKKCKLFYKKDEQFKNKGVGMLHLKRLEDEKVQLLVRADTNLGNILLNIRVDDSMTFKKFKNNNVLIICVPNPPLSPNPSNKPVSFLVRVKSEVDAEELVDMLEKSRNSTMEDEDQCEEKPEVPEFRLELFGLHRVGEPPPNPKSQVPLNRRGTRSLFTNSSPRKRILPDLDACSDRRVIQNIGSRLRNLLKLPKAHRWVYFEWFYSNIDETLFSGENDFQICLRESFPALKTRLLTRVEWCKIKRMMGKPRRCSQAFFKEERDFLSRKRAKLRQLQQGELWDIDKVRDQLPDEIPLPLTVGQSVTARLRKPINDGLFTGTVQAVDTFNNTYRISFDRADIGTHSVPDYEVMSNGLVETITFNSFIANMRVQHKSPWWTPVKHGQHMAGTSLTPGASVDGSPQLANDPILGNSSIPLKARLLEGSLGFPVCFLVHIVRLQKILALKKEKVGVLKTMNTEAEKCRSYGYQVSRDFKRRYATVVLDLEKLNKDLNRFLLEVQEFCQEWAPEHFHSAPSSHFKELCNDQARLLVTSYNNRGESSATSHVKKQEALDLIIGLTSLLIQVKSLAENDMNSYELGSLTDTMEDLQKELHEENSKKFQDEVEVHLRHFQAGLAHTTRQRSKQTVKAYDVSDSEMLDRLSIYSDQCSPGREDKIERCDRDEKCTSVAKLTERFEQIGLADTYKNNDIGTDVSKPSPNPPPRRSKAWRRENGEGQSNNDGSTFIEELILNSPLPEGPPPKKPPRTFQYEKRFASSEPEENGGFERKGRPRRKRLPQPPCMITRPNFPPPSPPTEDGEESSQRMSLSVENLHVLGVRDSQGIGNEDARSDRDGVVLPSQDSFQGLRRHSFQKEKAEFDLRHM
ncbi:unnamed protein product, partial [Darwinula stevensoni]